MCKGKRLGEIPCQSLAAIIQKFSAAGCARWRALPGFAGRADPVAPISTYQIVESYRTMRTRPTRRPNRNARTSGEPLET